MFFRALFREALRGSTDYDPRTSRRDATTVRSRYERTARDVDLLFGDVAAIVGVETYVPATRCCDQCRSDSPRASIFAGGPLDGD